MAQPGTIALKVTVPGDQLKSLRFSLAIPIAQIIEEIKEKINFPPGVDHGLFQPEIPGKSKARWLNPSYTLQFYQLSIDVRFTVPCSDRLDPCYSSEASQTSQS